jgi:hypothetical protein
MLYANLLNLNNQNLTIRNSGIYLNRSKHRAEGSRNMDMPMQLLAEPTTNDVLKSKADLDRDQSEAHDRGGNGSSAPSWRLRRPVL